MNENNTASGPTRRTYTLYTVADVPWGTFPSWDHGGPALVVVDGWGTSRTTGDGIDGHRVSAYKVPIQIRPGAPDGGIVYHWLNGVICPTREQADRLRYEAGLLAYFVYDDSPWAPATQRGLAAEDALASADSQRTA